MNLPLATLFSLFWTSSSVNGSSCYFHIQVPYYVTVSGWKEVNMVQVSSSIPVGSLIIVMILQNWSMSKKLKTWLNVITPEMLIIALPYSQAILLLCTPSLCSYKDLSTNLYNSIIRDNLKLDIIQMSINWIKENVVYPYNEMQFRHKVTNYY